MGKKTYDFISQNEILSYVDSDFNLLKKIVSFFSKDLLRELFEVIIKENSIKMNFEKFFRGFENCMDVDMIWDHDRYVKHLLDPLYKVSIMV